MLTAQPSAEAMLDRALDVLARGDDYGALDQLPVPVYVTDAQGLVTYWNQACVDFAGRVPEAGRDRWCVTWNLHTTTGEPLPHDKCPMAQAIERKQPVRDTIAIAERPDGSRRAFCPYPTPLFAADGTLRGAVNLLIDVTAEQAPMLEEQAGRCRRLAAATYDRETCGVLDRMAEGYRATAAALHSSRSASQAAAV